MTIFEGLLIAHVVGDWLLQTEWMALNKATDWRALIVHVLVYHAVMAAILIVGYPMEPGVVLLVVFALAVFHAILDRRRVTDWYMRAMRMVVNQAPPLWLRVAVDQALHVVSLAVAAALLQQFAMP
ncbi:MAG: hypothetical protein Kow0074_17180 [Candidatus Zixiibacteriota bacterium]